jgi:hypothetical protein
LAAAADGTPDDEAGDDDDGEGEHPGLLVS